MPTPRTDITLERLKELLTYDPIEGVFVWRVTNSNRAPAGSKAGSLRKRGDIGIRVDGVEYKAHRLAHFYMTGEWPPDQIDHRNLVRSNNQWDNLRPADNAHNNANRNVLPSSRTGLKNVSYYPNCPHRPYIAWASLGGSGRKKYMGAYATAEEAFAVAEAAGKERYNDFYRG